MVAVVVEMVFEKQYAIWGPWSGAGGGGAQPQVGASLNAGAPGWGT